MDSLFLDLILPGGALLMAFISLRRTARLEDEVARLRADLRILQPTAVPPDERTGVDETPAEPVPGPAASQPVAPRPTWSTPEPASRPVEQPEAIITSQATGQGDTTSWSSDSEHPSDRDAGDAEETPVAPPPAAARIETEQALAMRWSVWIGGVALAVGGLMIVRYSIEAGVFGPGVRLAMGAAFSLLLAGVSELIRRKDVRIAVGRFPTDQIPAVLAGVSVLSAFGVSYAAHAVYGIIGPAPAFTIMGAIGLAALAASLIHGSRFALFGLLGSYATPFLVSGTEPNFAALAIFASIVTTAAFLLHLRRNSLALITGAIVGQSAWTALIGFSETAPAWAVAMLLVSTTLAVLEAEVSDGGSQGHGRPAWFHRIAAFAAPLVLGGVLWVSEGGSLWFVAALAAIVLGSVTGAIRYRRLAPLAPIAGAAATGIILLWPTALGPLGVSLQLFIDLVRLDVVPDTAPGLVPFALLLAAIVAVPALGGLFARWRNGAGSAVDRGCIAFVSALTPIAIMLATSLRLNGFDRTMGFAVLAAVLVLALAAVSEILFRREAQAAPDAADPLSRIGSAAYAAGAAIALGLAVAFALRETWLVVGFAVASGGTALVAHVRPIPFLRSLAAALGTAALARVLWQPVLNDVGDLPIINWLIVVYGLPTVAFAAAAWALSDRRDRALSVSEGLATFFLTAFVVLEVVQASVGTDLWPQVIDLLLSAGDFRETRVHGPATDMVASIGVAVAFLALAFRVLNGRTDSPVFATAERIAAITLVPIALGALGVYLNPLLSSASVFETPIVNRLLFCYVGLGGIFLLMSSRLPHPERAGLLRPVLEGVGMIMTVLGATLVLRHLFAGPHLSILTGETVGFFEMVSMILLWQVLAGMLALWRGSRRSQVLEAALSLLGIALIAGSLLGLGLVLNPMIDGSGVEGPIVFNRILWGYAPVSFAFVALSRIIGGDMARLRRALFVAGTIMAGIMVFLLIRHAFHGPALVSDLPVTLAEAGIFGAAALVAAWVGSVMFDQRSTADEPPRPTIYAFASIGTLVVLLATAADADAGLVGWLFLNNGIPGLLLPAALAAAISLWSERSGKGRLVARTYGLAAVGCGLAYAMVQVRFVFPDSDWLYDGASGTDKTQLFGYSFAIIAYGIALLVAGLRFSHQDLRLAALGVVALAVFKVFLLDLSGLEGLWRAASFIGLGAGLIGIAYLYRRLQPPPQGVPL